MAKTALFGNDFSMQLPPAIFIADSSGLDFLNSIATPVDTQVDWISNGDGLLRWLAQANIVPVDVLDELKARAMPGELDKVADQARALREWFRGFVRQHMGQPLTPKAVRELEPLNRLLERDEAFSQIVRIAMTMAISWDCNGCGAGARRIRCCYRSAKRWRNFVCDEDFSDVKACEGQSCTLMFADHTRGRARRWCSMAICGNRAKQAAHRTGSRANVESRRLVAFSSEVETGPREENATKQESKARF